MSIKIENIVKNGRTKPYLSKFLTIAEQYELSKYIKEVNIVFSNTYIDEERKRAFVYPMDMNTFPMDMTTLPDFKITYLKIISKQKLNHPDILGAILNTGIDRETVGDILVNEQIVISTSEIANYIISNTSIINRQRVEIEKIDSFDYLEENNYDEKQIIISSMRLDGILAKSMNISRSSAQELINKRIVKINGNIDLRCDYNCTLSDTISITRKGRIKIQDVTRKTKKDKLVLNILFIKI